jgi:UDP-N-acetyl-D-glucosamine dehydrogenase
MLGVAYKSDVADTRESPALDIMRLLEDRGASVVFNDPFVPSLRSGDTVLKSVPLTAEEIADADCVVVTCRHQGVDFDLVAEHARVIVDTRNAYPRNGDPYTGKARLVKL